MPITLALYLATTSVRAAPPSLEAHQDTPTVSSAAQADEGASCVGVPVGGVRLEGCDGLPCGDPRLVDGFLSLTDFQPDTPITAMDRDRALARLGATGFFRQAELRCTEVDGALDVTVRVVPNTFVRGVSVEGNVFFRERELRKRIFLRAGTVLNVEPGAEAESEVISRQRDSLKRLYRREGLDEVVIDVQVSRATASLLDVAIVIREGERERIRRLDLKHVQAGRGGEGMPDCPRVSRRQLHTLVQVEVGEVVTVRSLRDIKRRTEAWFQSIGYVRPHVSVRADGDPLVLRMDVRTSACWLLRIWERSEAARDGLEDRPSFRRLDRVGQEGATTTDGTDYDRVDLETWRGDLPFGESGVFDREEAERGVESIRRTLQRRGYLFAQVRMEHRPLAPRLPAPGGGRGSLAGTIDYLITLHHERRLHHIDLPGRKTVSRDVLLAEMDTNTYDFFGEGGHVHVERVLFDLTKIKRFYRSRGFYDFRYLLLGDPTDVMADRTVVDSDEWIVWEYRFRDRGFRVRKRPHELGVSLEIPFVEGPRTRLRYLEVIGNVRVSNRQAKALLALGARSHYGSEALERGLERLAGWYRLLGYHHAEVKAHCLHVGRARAEEACDVSDVRVSTVDLVIRIAEGPQTRVGEIFWRGNTKTSSEVLLRDLPKPGQPFSEKMLADAAAKMRNLGIFSAVQIDRIALDERPARGRVALVVVVEEAESRFVDLAAGFRTIDREADASTKAPAWLGSIVGQSTAAADRSTSGLGRPFALSLPDVLVRWEAEYLDLNFRGMGQRFRVPFQYGFSTTDSMRLLSLAPTWTVPRIFDSDVHMELQLLGELDKVTEQLDRTEIGIRSSLVWPLSRRMSVSTGLDAGYIRFLDPDGSVPESTQGDVTSEAFRPQVRPSVRWRWDTQDNPLNPTRGFALAAEVGYILEIDRETIAEQRTTQLNDFVKWEMSAEFAYETPLGPVVAGFVRYGGSLGESEELLPPNERFTLGGSNGMRGFADHAVGRYDAEGNLAEDLTDMRQLGGGNVITNGSFEFRFPVMRHRGLWMAAFFDAGALARTHEQLTLGSVRASTGLGLRYLIGHQIPVRLDWGWLVGDPRCIAWRADAPGEVCQTVEDPAALHFDLLYPF